MAYGLKDTLAANISVVIVHQKFGESDWFPDCHIRRICIFLFLFSVLEIFTFEKQDPL